MREVIERAAGRFGWWGYKGAAGMACNLEKDAHMAWFAEVEVNGAKVRVARMTIAFDCGAVLNPDYLRNQAIVHTRGADSARMGPSAEGRTRIPGVPTTDCTVPSGRETEGEGAARLHTGLRPSLLRVWFEG